MTETAMATIPEDAYVMLSVQRGPEEVLEEAHRAAKALKGVLDAKPNKVIFNDETYLEFEDWQTVGRFYGIAPHVVWTRPLDLGEGLRGWEARVEAIHVPTQRVVASAEAMCMNDEEKWSARSKYAWAYVKKSGGHSVEDPGRQEIIWEARRDGKGNAPKKERVLIGEEKVPSFQLRSMAQTRAGSKALRNALAWVVVLAGYRPTPAEEMSDVLPARDVEAPPAPSPPALKTIDMDPATLFPTAEDEERGTLMQEVTRLSAKLKLKPEQRAEYRKTYLGGSDPLDPTLDIAALRDLTDALLARAGEPKRKASAA